MNKIEEKNTNKKGRQQLEGGRFKKDFHLDLKALNKLEKIKKETGFNYSKIIRNLILNKDLPKPKLDIITISNINKIGNNLNQYVKILHSLQKLSIVKDEAYLNTLKEVNNILINLEKLIYKIEI